VVGFAFWICIAYGSDTTALKMPAQYSVILLGGISGKNSIFWGISLLNHKFMKYTKKESIQDLSSRLCIQKGEKHLLMSLFD
jgi:hypothetical protein